MLEEARHDIADFFFGNIGGVTSQLNISFVRIVVVATVGDLNRYIKGLIRGELFQGPETLVAMTQWRHFPGINAPRAGVGLGVFGERTTDNTV